MRQGDSESEGAISSVGQSSPINGVGHGFKSRMVVIRIGRKPARFLKSRGPVCELQ